MRLVPSPCTRLFWTDRQTDGRTDGRTGRRLDKGLADGRRPSASWGAPAPQAPRPSARDSAPLHPSLGGTFAVPPFDAALFGSPLRLQSCRAGMVWYSNRHRGSSGRWFEINVCFNGAHACVFQWCSRMCVSMVLTHFFFFVRIKKCGFFQKTRPR